MPTIEAPQVEKVVYDALESFGADPSELAPDATFEQLDVDSLDLAELAQIAEDRFAVKIDSGDAEQLKTVGDVVELIVARS